MALTGRDDQLIASLVVTAGVGGDGGTVVPIPASVGTKDQAGTIGITTGNSFDEGGIDQLRTAAGDQLSFGFSNAETLDAATIEALATAAGPITINLADNLNAPAQNGQGEEVRYRAGELTLQPNEVVDFLSLVGAGEPVTNQALRYQTTLEALLKNLAGKDLSAIGGADGDGSSFVALLPDLLAGDVTFDQAPLVEEAVPGSYYRATLIDAKSLPLVDVVQVKDEIAAAQAPLIHGICRGKRRNHQGPKLGKEGMRCKGLTGLQLRCVERHP